MLGLDLSNLSAGEAQALPAPRYNFQQNSNGMYPGAFCTRGALPPGQLGTGPDGWPCNKGDAIATTAQTGEGGPLKNCMIFYNPRLPRPNRIPGHVEALRRARLAARCRLALRSALQDPST